MSLVDECPCGTGERYDRCCGRLHRGADEADSAEQLMRARYSAYAVGGQVGEDYVFRTWHPRTRPADVSVDPGLTWTGLDVLEATDEEVEFVAHYDYQGRANRLHEHSRFERRANHWVYLGPREPTTSSTSS